MAKKTRKQIASEKKLAKLKKEHDKLTREKKVIQARLNREQSAREKVLARLDKAIERAQAAYDKEDKKFLPSTGASQKINDRIYKLENKIRAQQQVVELMKNPPKPAAPSQGSADEERGPQSGDE